jgi:hypothetical protein
VRTTYRRTLAMAACAAILAAPGCGSEAPPPDAADMQPAVTPGGGDLPPVEVDTTAVVDAAAVDVTLRDYEILLSRDSIPAGAVTFNIRNDGATAHAFRIHGGADEWETDQYSPGEQVSMSVALQPGTYQLECTVGAGEAGHAARGMRRSLKVY